MTPDCVTNEAQVGLPPLQLSRKAVWDYYRIEFLPSGYPGRRESGDLHAHPIYGTYVIADYLAQYRSTRRLDYLVAAQTVADAAIAQMEEVDGGLAFMYRPEGTGVSLRKSVFYSGLTQARYVESLFKLRAVSEAGRYDEALRRVLASLTVSVERGGVATYTDSGGLVIEEYPSAIPDFTLNGWTTATTILSKLPSHSSMPDVTDVFRESVQGLEELVSLYDVPELANSRYRLTGPAEIYVSSETARFQIVNCAVEMPGFGVFDASAIGAPAAAGVGSIHAKVGQTVMREFGYKKHLVVQLSRASWPKPNRILLTLDAESATNVDVAIGTGSYDPLRVAIEPDSSRGIANYELVAGRNVLTIDVPWHVAELIAYPTNFRKKIAGIQFNQYHFIHVDTLRSIGSSSNSDVLNYFAERWAQYPDAWSSLPNYRNRDIALERFDRRKHV